MSDIPKSRQNLGKTEYFSSDFKHYRLPDEFNFDGTLEEIKEHPLNDIAQVVIKETNRPLNQIRAFVRMPGHKSVQLKVNTRAGVVNVTDTKNGDFTGTPWKVIRSYQVGRLGTFREDAVDQALSYIQTLIKPIEESDNELKEAIEKLESAGYVCEKWRGDDYVSDHLMNIEVPGLVHSCAGGRLHYFDSEEEDDYDAQLTITSDLRGRKIFSVWCKVDPMKEPLSEKGELPDFFWKSSSYRDGEMSRVSRWIKRKIETLRQNCLWRVKQLVDLS